MILYRVDVEGHYCPCKAFGYAKRNDFGKKWCKHLRAVINSGFGRDKWYIFKMEKDRWVCANHNQGFVAETLTDFMGETL